MPSEGSGIKQEGMARMIFIALHKKIIRIIVLLLVPFFLIAVHSRAEAESASEKLSEIKDKIKSKMMEVVDAKEKEESIGAALENIDQNVNRSQKELNSYNRRISQTEEEINELIKEIDDHSRSLEAKEISIEEYVRALYKRKINNNALILISADDYQDLIRKSKYISLVAYHNTQALNEYKDELNEILTRKEKLDSMRDEIADNKKRIERKKEKLEYERNRKNELLAEVKAKRAAQEKQIKELEESSEKIQSMISKLETKSIPQALIGDGFVSAKGNLPWPIEGEVITPFGEYIDADLSVKSTRSGIEIKVDEGQVPKSIAGGRVVFASSFNGMGKIVIIDHGSGYHSLYGNLSEVALEKGDLLIAGFDIGKIGKSKISSVPSLYFEIRYRGKPIDPMEWITKKGDG